MIMSNPLRERDRLAVPLPITDNARHIARQFAQAQATAQKAEQVKQNTLAVWVTHNYCEMMGIPTDLEQSDSWNPLMQIMANVADLVLPTLGKLECRPIQVEADACVTPPEVWDLRIGYVVIEIDDDCQTAKLLGFTPTVTGEELWVSQLQPPEDLLDHLYNLKQSSQVTTPASPTERQDQVNEAMVNLSQWLNHTFEASWQAVETLLSPHHMTPAVSFRSTEPDQSTEIEPALADVRRAKLIDLAVQLGPRQVVLLVELRTESPDKTHIGLQVHPAQAHPYLPAGLELAVLEPSDAVFMEAQARQADNFLQLRFIGKPGERFKVRINLEGIDYVEEFIV